MADKELKILLSVYNALQDVLGEVENEIHENSNQGYFQDMPPLQVARLVKDSPNYNPDDKYVREIIVDNKVKLVSTNDPIRWIENEGFGIV